jgi:hypothetical protein
VLHYRNEVAIQRAMKIFLPMMFVILFGSPLIVNAWLRREYSGWGWSGLFAVYFIELMVLYSVVYGPSFLMSQRPRRRFPNLTIAYGIVFGWAICATAGIGLLVLNYSQVLNLPLPNLSLQILLAHVHYATLFSLSGVLLLFTALAIFLAAHYAVFQRDFERRYADAMIVIELLDLLYSIEKQEKAWNELAFKRSTVHILEKIANRVAHDLPGQLRSGDAPTDAWFRGTAARIAAAFREKKKWILLPKADSRAYLLNQLKDDFIKAANGNWDGVSRADPQALSARNALMLARETAMNLIRGALPLAALFLVHRGLGLLSDEVFDSLLIGAVLWFILTLLMEIDPLFKEKVSTLKDVIGLVR